MLYEVITLVSLDYQHTLMAAAGDAAEAALRASMQENYGQYILLVTGSVPLEEDGIYLVITSYSIHYTKLYDQQCRCQPGT